MAEAEGRPADDRRLTAHDIDTLAELRATDRPAKGHAEEYDPASLAVVGVGLLGLLGARLRRRVTVPRTPVSPTVG